MVNVKKREIREKMSNLMKIGMCKLASKDYNIRMPQDHRLMVKNYTIDPKKYREFMQEAKYSTYSYSLYKILGENNPLFIKKSLEHFISFDILNIQPADVLIDIACHDSPFSHITKKIVGCETYKQDIIFAKGIKNNKIGGSASDMPIPANFASVLSLHSSFEHFEGDSDSLFIQECERVLKPGGKACIVEFFISEEYSILTDPKCWEPDIPGFDNRATVYLAKGWKNRFGRFYDWDAFSDRILSYLGNLRLCFYNILNPKDIHPAVYMVRAGVIEKPQ